MEAADELKVRRLSDTLDSITAASLIFDKDKVKEAKHSIGELSEYSDDSGSKLDKIASRSLKRGEKVIKQSIALLVDYENRMHEDLPSPRDNQLHQAIYRVYAEAQDKQTRDKRIAQRASIVAKRLWENTWTLCVSWALDKKLPPGDPNMRKQWNSGFGMTYGDELMLFYDAMSGMLEDNRYELDKTSLELLSQIRDGLATTGLLIDAVKAIASSMPEEKETRFLTIPNKKLIDSIDSSPRREGITGSAERMNLTRSGLVLYEKAEKAEKAEDTRANLNDALDASMESFCKRLKKLPLNESELKFELFSAGTASHAVMIMVMRQNDGKYRLVYLNTGYMKPWSDPDDEGRVLCFARYDDLPSEKVVDPELWRELIMLPTQSDDPEKQMKLFNDRILLLGKSGKVWKGTDSQRRRLRHWDQFQGSCAGRVILALLKHLFMSPSYGSSDNYMSYRRTKEALLGAFYDKRPKTLYDEVGKEVCAQLEQRIQHGNSLLSLMEIAQDGDTCASICKAAKREFNPYAKVQSRFDLLRSIIREHADQPKLGPLRKASNKRSILSMIPRKMPGAYPDVMGKIIMERRIEIAILEERVRGHFNNKDLKEEDKLSKLIEEIRLAPFARNPNRRTTILAELIDKGSKRHGLLGGNLLDSIAIYLPQYLPRLIVELAEKHENALNHIAASPFNQLSIELWNALIDSCIVMLKRDKPPAGAKQLLENLANNSYVRIMLEQALARELVYDRVKLPDLADSRPTQPLTPKHQKYMEEVAIPGLKKYYTIDETHRDNLIQPILSRLKKRLRALIENYDKWVANDDKMIKSALLTDKDDVKLLALETLGKLFCRSLKYRGDRHRFKRTEEFKKTTQHLLKDVFEAKPIKHYQIIGLAMVGHDDDVLNLNIDMWSWLETLNESELEAAYGGLLAGH